MVTNSQYEHMNSPGMDYGFIRCGVKVLVQVQINL